MSKPKIRDIMMAVLMIGAGLYVLGHPIEKYAAEEKIDLPSFIPSTFGSWKSETHDTSDYKDKWQSINEVLVRDYYKGERRKKLGFILEYSSDLRKNFSFHFPENCHRAGGNEVDFLEPLEVTLADGKVIKSKCLYIKGREGGLEGIDNVVAYWLTIDNTQYYRTFFIKLDQLLSGLLKRAKRGFLIRLDYFEGIEYTDEHIQKARKAITDFIKELYNALDEESREMLFGSFCQDLGSRNL